MVTDVRDVPVIVGTENEYGITGAQPGEITTAALRAAGASKQGNDGVAVRWDYSSELPLRDARGFTLAREHAHPSMLTDIEGADSPSGPIAGRSDDESAIHPGENKRTDDRREQFSDHGTIRPEFTVRLTHSEEHFQRGTASAMANGARLYVDHGHPEYATPECSSPAQAVLYDRVGDQLMGRARHYAGSTPTARLFKNNVDGKGASYGTHENYLVTREVPFTILAHTLIPFFVTRPILVGAGRWGIGQVSEQQAFQISQRADYIEQVMSLGTTVHRPIINTRDEPHTDPTGWRRLHVIVGDANAFDTMTWLRLGMTTLVLSAVSAGRNQELLDCALADPVTDMHRVSHDLTLSIPLRLATGDSMTALDIQRRYLRVVAQAWGVDLASGQGSTCEGGTACAPAGHDDHSSPSDGAGLRVPTPDLTRFTAGTRQTWHEEALALIDFWDQSLTALEMRAQAIAGGIDPMSPDLPASHLEWATKAAVIGGALRRHAADPEQANAVAAAVDLAWAELGDGKGVAMKTPQGQENASLWPDELLASAHNHAPATTRAFLRGYLIEHFGHNVVAAGWHSVIMEVFDAHHWRLPLTDVQSFTQASLESVLAPEDLQATMEALTRLRPPDRGTVAASYEGQEPQRERHPFSPSAIAHPPVHRSAGGGPIAPYAHD